MNTPVLKIFGAVIPTIFDSFLRVNCFCAYPLFCLTVWKRLMKALALQNPFSNGRIRADMVYSTR